MKLIKYNQKIFLNFQRNISIVNNVNAKLIKIIALNHVFRTNEFLQKGLLRSKYSHYLYF